MDEWVITFDGWDPADVALREALTTVGNGYVATRGAAPETDADGMHYPGTYVAGVFNRLGTEVGGRIVEDESLVNAPNWLALTFRIDDGPWFGADSDVLEHHLELDLRRAVLTRRARLRDVDGHVVGLVQRRFVSMRDRHLAGLQTTLVAENWSGRLEVRSAIDGTVRNAGVARYRALESVHLCPIETGARDDEVVHLVTETNQSHVRIGMAARTRLARGGEPLAPASNRVVERVGYVARELGVDVAEGDQVVVEKIAAIFTCRDEGITEPALEADDWATNIAGSFETLLARHTVEWSHLWNRMDVTLGTDGDVAALVHLHQLHLLQTVSNNSVGADVGVPARGLHGEAYRGHIFWDELFVFPFLSLHFPQLSRALLLYRYRRLDQARRNATAAGYEGAMYPWQSASNGREETQTMHLNPNSGRWNPDASHLQRHVNAAIALSVWQYYQATGDLEFLRFHGAEMIFEIARFWASTATYNHGLDRYEITGVMGPDEYHDGYPDREEPGLDNNAYTNIMAVWCLCRAFDVIEVLPPVVVRELEERLGLTHEELDRWNEVSRKMRVCFHDGVISQFEGYELLEELDWERYRKEYGDIHRLDRILEAEGDSTNRYKLAKQPDVMMLFYVLSASELTDLLVRLGHPCDGGIIGRSIDYYTPRTAHGSTLSRVVHAWITARRDRSQSWAFFVEALRSDFDDIQGGTTGEGIHLGAMAGTIDLLQRCYSGLETREDVIRLDPAVPAELGRMAFDLRYRGHRVELDLTPDSARVRVDVDEGAPINVECRRRTYLIEPGTAIDIDLR